ncbi:hypothetical protein CJF47_08195 [Aeromonas sobria]|nr:hypothetical protein CJF47_08195 [Aeromonas sobria]
MARLFLNQPMITSLLRALKRLGIDKKPAKIGLSRISSYQVGKTDTRLRPDESVRRKSGMWRKSI